MNYEPTSNSKNQSCWERSENQKENDEIVKQSNFTSENISYKLQSITSEQTSGRSEVRWINEKIENFLLPLENRKTVGSNEVSRFIKLWSENLLFFEELARQSRRSRKSTIFAEREEKKKRKIY